VRSRLVSAGYRIFGKPPAANAPRKERLLWLRRYYLRTLLVSLPALVLLAVYSSRAWVWAVLGAGALVWVQGFASLSVRIRRERRRGDAPDSRTAG
jgi:hypothetical protein